ncbi:MAG: TRAP transporter substrate-binding protein DctP [Myxococcota bacterium]
MFSRKSLLTAACAVAVSATTAAHANAGQQLRFATLAPPSSHYGKVFKALAKKVQKRSNGQVEVLWDFGGVAGDEAAIVAKAKSGQLDGGAVTSVGLGAIYKPFLALQMPGYAKNWAQLDRARRAVFKELQQGARKNGFHFLGPGDIGMARLMSTNIQVRTPADLKKAKVYAWQSDPTTSVTASVFGITPHPSTPTMLLSDITASRVDVFTTPAFAAQMLQWGPHVKHVIEKPMGLAIGGLVIKAEKLDAMPADVQKMFKKTSRGAAKLLIKGRPAKNGKRAIKGLRDLDEDAYAAMNANKYSLTQSEQAAWDTKFAEIRKRLGQTVYSPTLVKRLEDAAAGR